MQLTNVFRSYVYNALTSIPNSLMPYDYTLFWSDQQTWLMITILIYRSDSQDIKLYKMAYDMNAC